MVSLILWSLEKNGWVDARAGLDTITERNIPAPSGNGIVIVQPIA